jgi:predicted enzyme related to lactoylglutathione lyase
MTVTGVAAVWLPVQDMDRAVGFYRDTLGLDVKTSDGDWADFEANGLRVGLNARESPGGSSDGGAVISFQPDDGIEGAVSELEDKGVEFTGGVSEHEWGKIAPFKDSEGNDLQLYEPPQG